MDEQCLSAGVEFMDVLKRRVERKQAIHLEEAVRHQILAQPLKARVADGRHREETVHSAAQQNDEQPAVLDLGTKCEVGQRGKSQDRGGPQEGAAAD